MQKNAFPYIPVHIVLPYQKLITLIIGLGLFGQIFFSNLAYQLDISNRLIMLIMRFIIALLSVISLFGINRDKKWHEIFTPWIGSLLLFWFLYFARLLIDTQFLSVSTAIPAWELIAWGIGSSLLPCCAAYYLARKCIEIPSSDKLLKYALPLVIAAALLFSLDPGFQSIKFQLPSLNPINSGHASASLGLIGASSLMSANYSQQNHKLKLVVAVVSIALGSYLCVYSATRSAVLAFFIPFLTSFLLIKPSSTLKIPKKITYLTISTGLLVLFIYLISPPLMNKIISFTSHPHVLTRVRLIRFALNSFIENPLFGVGFDLHSQLQSLSSEWGESLYFTHNYLAESLALGGITLTIPLIVCFVRAFYNIFIHVRVQRNHLWILLLLQQSLLYVMTTGHFGDVPMFWILIGLSAGIRKPKSN